VNSSIDVGRFSSSDGTGTSLHMNNTSTGGKDFQILSTGAGAGPGAGCLGVYSSNYNFVSCDNGGASVGTNTYPTLADGLVVKGTVKPAKYATATACASSGGTCGSAAAGAVSIAAGATTVTVSTTAVNTASQILLQDNSTLGSTLSVTCNTADFLRFKVTTVTNGTSFVITSSAAPSTNPACISYFIAN
jgi:hypothetical protein